MSPKLRLSLCLAAFASIFAAELAAQNLVRNPGFRDDLTFWNVATDPGLSVLWQTADASASPSSGSAAVTNESEESGLQVTGLTQCIDVSSLQEYELSADLLMAGGQGVSGRGIVSLFWFDSGGCNGFLSGENAVQLLGPSGWFHLETDGLIPEDAVSVRVNVDVLKNENFGELTVAFDNIAFRPVRVGTCAPTETALCLNEGRFRVTTHWRRADGAEGEGQAVTLTDDTGYFWFFNSANVEMVVKVLSNCQGATNRYWVFAGGLTNVEVEILVEDTLFPGVTKTYTNPLSTPFQPIQDTQAFATCP